MADPKKRVENTWNNYRAMVIPKNASDVQVRECRLAFFAGATSLFTLMMAGLQFDNDEPTEEELAYLEDIQAELDEFGEAFDAKYLPAKGSA